MVPDEEASASLRQALERARAPDGSVANVMRVHSLRPHTMDGHVALYESVLHHPGNSLPGWFLETVGAYVSSLNRCAYSFTNHWANAAHLIDDEARAAEVHDALVADRLESAFDGKQLALLRYVRKLTLAPGKMTEADLDEARSTGATDGEILEVNQVAAYFAYANRLLNGLGVTLEGDVIGYYGTGRQSSSP